MYKKIYLYDYRFNSMLGEFLLNGTVKGEFYGSIYNQSYFSEFNQEFSTPDGKIYKIYKI